MTLHPGAESFLPPDLNRLIESQSGLGWKRPEVSVVPTRAVGRAAPQQLRLPRASSSLASRDGAPQLLWAAVPDGFL